VTGLRWTASRRDLGITAAGAAVTVLLASAVALAQHPLAAAVLGVAAATLGYAVTTRYLTAVACLLVVATAAVPIYWAIPPGSYLPLALTPIVVLGVLVGPIAALKTRTPQINIIDGLVAALALGQIASNYYNYERPFQLSLAVLLKLVLPYVAIRFVAGDLRRLAAVTVAVAASGGVLGYLAVYERLSGHNLFLELRTPGYAATVWAHPYLRFGSLRASESFGQPLVFGMWLALCAVLCAALIQVSTSRAGRLWSVVALVGVGSGLWATQVRAPLAVAVGGYLLYVVAGRRVRWGRQIVLPAAAVLLVGLFTPLGSQLALFWQSTFGGAAQDATFTSSTAYRGTLLDALARSRNYSALGIAHGNPSDPTTVMGVQGTSVDNEYLLRLVQYGTVGLVLFVALGLAVFWALARITEPIARAWTAATAVTFIGLGAVALLLQQADFFWMGIAVTATAITTGRSIRRPGQVERDAAKVGWSSD
jgi:hypothetical protein